MHIHSVPVPSNPIDLTWMVGRSITTVMLLEPLPWRFEFGARERLDVECLWRIVRDGQIRLTSDDHGQLFGLPAPVDCAREATELLATPVMAVGIRASTADITIDFEGGAQLEVLPTSSGYEAWQVCCPDGTCYVATGGGTICMWKAG